MPVLSIISRETDEHGFVRSETYKSERGFEFAIEPTAGGLYSVVAKSGGKTPAVCNGLYTSHLVARNALIKYLQDGDRLGYAEYPGKPEEKKRKPKTDGSSTNE